MWLAPGKPRLWRLVLLIGGLLGAAQAVLLAIVPESPAYLYKVGKKEEARKALIRLRGSNDIEEEFASFAGASAEGKFLVFFSLSTWLTCPIGAEAEPLLPATQKIVGLGEFATARKYRWSLMLVVGIMLAQQFTGRSPLFHLAHHFPARLGITALTRDYRHKRGRDVRSCNS